MPQQQREFSFEELQKELRQGPHGNENRLAEVEAEAAEAKLPPPTSHASKLRKEAALRWARDVLKTIPKYVPTGQQMHPEDREELLRRVASEVSTAPPRVRAEFAKVAERMISQVESGDNAGAKWTATEQPIGIAEELAKATTWSVPRAEQSDIDAEVARIPRLS